MGKKLRINRICFKHKRINITITSTKRYVSIAVLSIKHNIKFFEDLKQGTKRTIACNKYRSEIKTKPET